MLGNCTKSNEFLQFVNEISSNVTIVRGEFDNSVLKAPNKDSFGNENSEVTNNNDTLKKKNDKDKQINESHSKNLDKIEIPLNAIIRIDNFKIGCCNGYTVVPKSDPLSLLTLARQLDVDILLWGGTHNVEAYTLENKFFVNPGSCTGAFNTDWPIISENIANSTNSLNEINEEENDTSSTKKDVKEEQDNSNDLENDNKKKNELEVDEEDEDEEDVPEMSITGSNSPSFCLLDIQGSTCTLYIYIYLDGEVKVDKVIYNKEQMN